MIDKFVQWFTYQRTSKIISFVLLLAGIAATLATITTEDELSASTQFVFNLAMCYGFFVLFDMAVLRNVNTIHEIIEKKNVAYAIVLCIPAFLCLAASVAL